MKTKLVIFDNDGVLVDSESMIKQVLIPVLAQYGAHITPQWSFRNLQGLRPVDVYRTIEEYTGVKLDIDACKQQYIEGYTHMIRTQLKPTPGVIEQIELIFEKGLKACVATSGGLDVTYLKHEVTGLDQYFPKTAIFSGTQVTHGKPAPDLFLWAAETMGFAPEECVVIEDAAAGVKAGKAAGMHTIGYTGGEHAPLFDGDYSGHLYDAGADLVIDHHNELFKSIP